MTLDLAEGQTIVKGAQLMPLGTWKHPQGDIIVDFDRAKSFEQQFKRSVAGQKLPILYIHSDKTNVSHPQYGKAAGWITDLRADENLGVVVDMEFTEPGAAAVKNKEYQYLSAEYFDKVQLPHHLTPEKDVIMAAALVNRPHLKGMKPILNEETGHLWVAAEETTEGGGPVDPILVVLAEQAGVEVPDDATELTEDQRSKITQFLTTQQTSLSEAQERIKTLESAEPKNEPKDQKIRSLEEAGFKEEAALLSKYRAERTIRELSEGLPEGQRLAPTVVQKIETYSEQGDEGALREAFKLVASGKGIVDLSEKGTSDGGAPAPTPGNEGIELTALANAKAKELDIPFGDAMNLVIAEHPDKWNAYQLSMGSDEAVIRTGGES